MTNFELCVDGVSAEYIRGVRAITNVSLEVLPGEIVAVLGSNGAGKSTLLGVIAGLLRVCSGHVSVGAVDITRHSVQKRVARGVALVPQGHQLFPNLSVRDNLDAGNWRRRRSAELRSAIFDQFPKLATRQRVAAGRLSGGERAMLAIGRALMSSPRILLLDEPSIGLSPIARQELFPLFGSLSRERNVTIVLAEQDVISSLSICGRVILLREGGVFHEASADEISDELVHECYFGGTKSDPSDSSGWSSENASFCVDIANVGARDVRCDRRSEL